MIFNIQKCSIHDGDGLRTLVFFKGCPLGCPWCANPESQSYGYEIMEHPSKCIGCGLCIKRCPRKAIDDNVKIDRALCLDGCTECTDLCYAEAKRIVGKEYSVDELFEEIKKDLPFYRINGGGVTFSGGEPFTQGKYLEEIARKCRKNRINVVVESCGFSKFEEFRGALPYIDALFMDIKLIDSRQHKAVTGAGNELILNNIKKISEFGIPITVRTPVVPGFTNSTENIAGIAEFIAPLQTVKEYELLIYHNLGQPKYESLGRPYELEHVMPPPEAEIIELVKLANRILRPYGKQCYYMEKNEKRVR